LRISGDAGGSFNSNVITAGGSGPAALSGSLKANLLKGYTPTAGSSFDILDFTSVSGDFGSMSLPTLGGGLMWDTRFLNADGRRHPARADHSSG
jgi:hypothetical protein